MEQSNLAEAKGEDKHRGHLKKRQFPFALYMFSQHHSRRLTTSMQLHTMHMLRFGKRYVLQSLLHTIVVLGHAGAGWNRLSMLLI